MEKIVELHDSLLADYAVKNSNSEYATRTHAEKKEDQRMPFEKDRDRVIHSDAYARLAKKTQVFPFGSGDHFRNRLTHTQQVAQVSRGIARQLRLNEDLAETIALAHDLGHPPFGHAGEDALRDMMHEYGGTFEHNQQSIRTVSLIEKSHPFDGLNLTKATLEGLDKHQTVYDQPEVEIHESPHLEAQVVNIADEIAYTAHDIKDGLRARILKIDQLNELKLWQVAGRRVLEEYGEGLGREVMISRVVSEIISILINDLIRQTRKNLLDDKIESLDDVLRHQGSLVEFSPETKQMLVEMRKYLYQNFYLAPEIREKTERGMGMIKALFKYFMEHPEDMTEAKYNTGDEPLYIRVKDYIAGMTDQYLAKKFEQFKLEI